MSCYSWEGNKQYWRAEGHVQHMSEGVTPFLLQFPTPVPSHSLPDSGVTAYSSLKPSRVNDELGRFLTIFDVTFIFNPIKCLTCHGNTLQMMEQILKNFYIK